MERKVAHCLTRIADEERRAEEAKTWDAAEAHRQVAMLYRAQLRLLGKYIQASQQPATLSGQNG